MSRLAHGLPIFCVRIVVSVMQVIDVWQWQGSVWIRIFLGTVASSAAWTLQQLRETVGLRDRYEYLLHVRALACT